jgi:Peptidase MA superfamily
MTKIRLIIIPLLGLLLCTLAIPVQAQAGIQLVSDTATLSFPNTATFKAEFKSGAIISSVVLEYGIDQLTCGTVIAKAFPQFTAAGDVQVTWSWDMRQSGSIPPGATLWWHWLVQDANGAQFTSPTQTLTWLDSTHPWQAISGGNITLHYYDGGQSFGQSLHDAAAQALARLSKDVGISSDKPVDIYIYANTSDLQASILYEPSWVGGQAFPETNIVIIGVSTDQLDWGKSTEAHELTHVLVGHLTFSCLGFIPTWLNEGLAMYGEGGPAAAEVNQFDQAKTANQLLALSSLAGAFSDEANRANLSYTEAYSVVNYLIQTYGRDKMTALLISLRNGNTIDQALQSAYGFDTNGLEDVWRASIGAAPRVGTSNPTPVFTPTQVPTFVPIGAAPIAPAVATPRPTQAQPSVIPASNTQPPGPAPTSVPLTQQLGISPGVLTGIEFGLIGCILAIGVIAVPVIVTTRRRNRRPK